MRTLYTRIVMTFIVISLTSSVLGLLLANLYYAEKLQGGNGQKILNIGKEMRSLYESSGALPLGEYLSHIANMGFQIYVVDNSLQVQQYGAPFKHQEMDSKYIEQVLNGSIYNGINEERHLLNIFGLFESSLQNSIGMPITADGKTYAMFIRPNLEQQIGEVRVILGVLLGVSFILSILLIIIASGYIVRPVKKLTAATNQIVNGSYDIEMDTARHDELGNLARHFTHMAHSLKQLDDMRQEFVANVSHEIQSPLTSIQGFSEAILEQEATPEEEKRYLQIIHEESSRLSSLSKQLLTLAALDKEENVMQLSTFRLDEQLRQILIVTEWQWSEKQLRIEPELLEITVTADETLLYQVWFNLITNSIKFSCPGGIVAISLKVDQDIMVTISDTGIGIPEGELPHIFDRFYKADKARNRARSGSGLGLSIVKKVITMHKGHIEVHSRSGEGTVFTITIPRL